MYSGGKTYALDSTRATTLFLHQAAPAAVLAGTSVPIIELTRFAKQIRQGPNEATVGLAWHDELYGAYQPRAGHVLEIKLEGESYWIGVVQNISEYAVASGEKSMSIIARSRDATPAWRDTRRVSDLYPTATPLAYIARQIAQSAGLTPAEITLPDAGASTVHSNTQLADLTPWQMLATLYQPVGLEPYVDCRGRLKCISRDTGRVPDIVLADNRRVVRVTGAKARPALTEMRIAWLDPKLSESVQQDRMLDRAAIHAGFFQLKQERDVYFGADQTQRARNTHMVVRQSANSGLLRVCSENYEQLSTTKGRITLNTSVWVPKLALDSIGVMLAATYIPDYIVPFTGPTIPVGRIVHGIAEAVIMVIMMSVGTGQYEVWGSPFDYVHARNKTTAFNKNAGVWEISPVEIENDFVMNEDQAQAFAIRELVYEHSSATSYGASIVDDTRIERGDIIEFRDGSRVYVTGFTRDLSHGAPALLEVQGFIAGTKTVSFAGVAPPPIVPPPEVPPDFGPPPPNGNLPPVYIVPILPPPPPVGVPPGGAPIYIPAVPVHVSRLWSIRILAPTYGTYFGESKAIREWSIGGIARKPQPGGDPLPKIYAYLEDGILNFPSFDAEPTPNGNATASDSWPLSDPSFAFTHVGIWHYGPKDSGNDAILQFAQGTGQPLGEVSADPGYSITAGSFEAKDGNAGPREWNIESDNKVIHVVRGGSAWPSHETRAFVIKHSGLNFYRLNIAATAGNAAGNAVAAVGSFQLYTALGGADACWIAGAPAGFGDAGGVYAPYSPGNQAFGVDAGSGGTGWIGLLSPQWLRFGFNAPTTVVQYGIRINFALEASAPRDWTLEVSVDGVNWYVIDSRTGVVFTPGVLQKFALARPVVFGNPP